MAHQTSTCQEVVWAWSSYLKLSCLHGYRHLNALRQSMSLFYRQAVGVWDAQMSSIRKGRPWQSLTHDLGTPCKFCASSSPQDRRQVWARPFCGSCPSTLPLAACESWWVFHLERAPDTSFRSALWQHMVSRRALKGRGDLLHPVGWEIPN